jgi:phage baseplate assembly protein W
MSLAFPFHLSPVGHTARSASPEAHVRELLQQLLLTRPGERVNRPQLGCGLGDLVFGPCSPEVAAAVSVTLSAAIAEFLGDLIRLRDLRVSANDSELRVDLAYELLPEGTPIVTSIELPGPA